MRPPLEKVLYPIVKRWLENHFLCFKADINKGFERNRPDVTGVRDIGGDLSGDVETIVVEVKRGQDPFARACGQALGYSVYANRVYLADIRAETFTAAQLQIASRLGIGLIRIWKRRCTEALSSPYYTPVQRLNLGLLENLGIAKCGLCSSFFETAKGKKLWANVVREDIDKAIQKEKGLVFWNYEVADRRERLRRGLAGYGRRYVCPDCVEGLLTIQDIRLKRWMKQHERERRG